MHIHCILIERKCLNVLKRFTAVWPVGGRLSEAEQPISANVSCSRTEWQTWWRRIWTTNPFFYWTTCSSHSSIYSSTELWGGGYEVNYKTSLQGRIRPPHFAGRLGNKQPMRSRRSKRCWCGPLYHCPHSGHAHADMHRLSAWHDSPTHTHKCFITTSTRDRPQLFFVCCFSSFRFLHNRLHVDLRVWRRFWHHEEARVGGYI